MPTRSIELVKRVPDRRRGPSLAFYRPCRPSKVAMKFIAQLQPDSARISSPGTGSVHGDSLLMIGPATTPGWDCGFGQSFGRSGSPLVVGPLVPAVATDGDTVTFAVSVATVSATRRNRV